MKTTVLLLLTSVLSGMSAYTQSTQMQAIPYEEFIAQKEQAKLQRDEQTPLSMVQRCTNTATYIDLVFSDTTRLTYTTPRGSVASKNSFSISSLPDTVFRITLNSNQASVKEINEYDAANKHIVSTYFLYGQQVGTASSHYNSNGTLSQYEYDYDDGASLKLYYKKTYNSEGLPLLDTTYQNSYGQQTSLDYFATYKYAYDLQNRTTLFYVHQAFINYATAIRQQTDYYFSGNNLKPFLDTTFEFFNLDTLEWVTRYNYHPNGSNLNDTTYNEAGEPVVTSQYTYNGPEVTNTRRTYNGVSWNNAGQYITKNNNDGNMLYSRNFTWDNANSNWRLLGADSSFYNSDGYLIRTHKLSVYNPDNTLKTTKRNRIERNSYNNPNKWTTSSFYNDTLKNETVNLYYYEDYDNGLSLEPVANKLRASIYPNPAQTTLKVQIDAINAKNFTIVIYALNGKTICRVPVTDPEQTLDISHLPAGTFILTIQDKRVTTLFSQKFLKQ